MILIFPWGLNMFVCLMLSRGINLFLLFRVLSFFELMFIYFHSTHTAHSIFLGAIINMNTSSIRIIIIIIYTKDGCNNFYFFDSERQFILFVYVFEHLLMDGTLLVFTFLLWFALSSIRVHAVHSFNRVLTAHQ